MQQFTLPDLRSMCPLKDATNPHHKLAAAESRAWINSFKVFSDEKRAAFIAGSNELLVSHAYPFAPYERFRVCCDFINTLFVVDEISDVQNGEDALSTGMIYLNVLKDPSWDDSSKLAQITREFVIHALYLRLILMTCLLPDLEPVCISPPSSIASAGSTRLAPTTSMPSGWRPSTGYKAGSSTSSRTRSFDGTTARFTLASCCSNTLWTLISPTRWLSTHRSRIFRTGAVTSYVGPT